MIRINGNDVWFSSAYRTERFTDVQNFFERPSSGENIKTAEIIKLEIPEGTESIGYYALACLPITEITIPASVKKIEEYVFRWSALLQKIVFAPRVGVPTIKTTSFSGVAKDGTSSASGSLPCDIYVPWAEGEVAGAPWGAQKATIHYNHK